MSNIKSLEKSRIALYHWLLGKGWFNAAEIMQYAEELHPDKRKDGITPEFSHQIWIANFIRTLPIDETTMQNCICIAFLHDTSEDKDIGFEELQAKYGYTIADGVKRLTKKFRGIKKAGDAYFADILDDPYSCIVKGVDRLHNISTMVGVFSKEKILSYILETETYHLPMIKKARKLYPQYWAVFENLKLNLNTRIDLIKEIINK